MAGMRSVVARIFLTPHHRLRLGWLLPLPVAGMLASLAPAMAVGVLLLPHVPDPVAPVAGLATFSLVALGAVGLTYVLRRHVDRRPWSDLGLTGGWAAVAHAVAGFVAGLAVVLVANTVGVGLGAVTWRPWTEIAPLLPGLAAGTLPILFTQAFPEELWFRGYQLRALGATLPLWSTVALTTAVFGAIHIVSRSSAANTGEQFLYVAQATSLGFALAMTRIATGRLWACIGLHVGYNAIHGALVTAQPGRYGIQLLALAGTLVTTGLILLVWRRRAPLEWRVPPGDDPAKGSEPAVVSAT